MTAGWASVGSKSLALFDQAQPSDSTVGHKNVPFMYNYSSYVSWQIYMIFVPLKTGMNTLQRSYKICNLTRHSPPDRTRCKMQSAVYVVFTFQCLILPGNTENNINSQLVPAARSIKTGCSPLLKKSRPMYLFSNFCQEIFKQRFGRKSFSVTQVFNRNLIIKAQHICQK